MPSLENQLSPIAEDRRAAVLAWLESSLGDCSNCGHPVRPVDPRKSSNEGITHLDCEASRQTQEPERSEPISAAVEARARRSDWG